MTPEQDPRLVADMKRILATSRIGYRAQERDLQPVPFLYEPGPNGELPESTLEHDPITPGSYFLTEKEAWVAVLEKAQRSHELATARCENLLGQLDAQIREECERRQEMLEAQQNYRKWESLKPAESTAPTPQPLPTRETP